jgi:hypothetical protein
MMTKDSKDLWRNAAGEYLFYWEWSNGGYNLGYNEEWAADEAHLKTVIAERFPSWADRVDWTTVRRITQAESATRERRTAMYWD